MKNNAWHQEQQRKKNDIIRVYNPTDEDFIVEYDRANGTKKFRVPAKQETPLIRYIAKKYIKKMYEKIITDKIQNAIIEENESRIEKGMAELDKTAKTSEQLRFESNIKSKIESTEGKKIMATLWLGIEQEFGIDREPEVQPVDDTDNRNAFDKMFDDLETKKVNDNSVQADNQDEKTESDNVIKCDYPGCDFETTTPVALVGHKRSHNNEGKKAKALAEVSA